MVEHKLRQQKQAKIDMNKNGYVRLLVNRVADLVKERGNLVQAFRRMKVDYEEGCKRDGVFVGSMMKNISKLCSLYERNRKWAASMHFYSWRQNVIQLKMRQE